MRITRVLGVIAVAGLAVAGSTHLLLLPGTSMAVAATTANVAVGSQYDTTHAYVAPEDFDRLVASHIATSGGTTRKEGVFMVTPTPSETMSQLILTPVGTISVVSFKTPIPYPFGLERTARAPGVREGFKAISWRLPFCCVFTCSPVKHRAKKAGTSWCWASLGYGSWGAIVLLSRTGMNGIDKNG
jgi:hypothetical protein